MSRLPDGRSRPFPVERSAGATLVAFAVLVSAPFVIACSARRETGSMLDTSTVRGAAVETPVTTAGTSVSDPVTTVATTSTSVAATRSSVSNTATAGAESASAIATTDADSVAAIAAVDAFFGRYVDDDGRVVRHDQGGDTVSEGQAYAMIMAAAIGDEAGFRTVWGWTVDHLQRDDWLFAWRWHRGRIVDDAPASDADLWIAGALSIAADRFGDPALAEQAQRIGDAVLRLETTSIAGRPVLVAGPWAREESVVNPSYLTTVLMTRLSSAGRPGWASVAATARQILHDLTADDPHLAPDFASVRANGGDLVAAPHEAPVSGWDAVRVPVQMAADCDPRGREIAARAWPFLLTRDVQVANVYSLDGSIIDPGQHAVAWVGAAGVATAAGAADSADVLLDRADSADRAQPTYYGAAWLAIGRLWLTTDLLGGCAGDPP